MRGSVARFSRHSLPPPPDCSFCVLLWVPPFCVVSTPQAFQKARKHFRAIKSVNRPTCECPNCFRGFGLRRDRRAHVKSEAKLCYKQDYLDVPEAYIMLDRRPGNIYDYAGTFYSDDSEPSASDDEEVQI